MTLMPNTTQIVAVQLAADNPELGQAAPNRVHEKARGLVTTVLLILFAVVLWLGGGIVTGGFAYNAIRGQQPLSLTMMAALGCPLIPAMLVSIFAAKYLDSDAGSVIDQMGTFVTAWRKRGTA